MIFNPAMLLVFWYFLSFMFFIDCLLWSLGNFLPKNPRVQVGPGRSVTCETEELLKSCGLRWAQWPSHSPILTNHLWGKLRVNAKSPQLGLYQIRNLFWDGLLLGLPHDTKPICLNLLLPKCIKMFACPIGFPRNVKPILGIRPHNSDTNGSQTWSNYGSLMFFLCLMMSHVFQLARPLIRLFLGSENVNICMYIYIYLSIYMGVCVHTGIYLLAGSQWSESCSSMGLRHLDDIIAMI